MSATTDSDSIAGGKAVVDAHSSTEGQAVIKTAVDAFGGVSILINNAGILRDKGLVTSMTVGVAEVLTYMDRRFKNMSDAEFDAVQAVHLKSSFACSKAVWPIFRQQKFGRIVNTASAAGLYGTVLCVLGFFVELIMFCRQLRSSQL